MKLTIEEWKANKELVRLFAAKVRAPRMSEARARLQKEYDEALAKAEKEKEG